MTDIITYRTALLLERIKNLVADLPYFVLSLINYDYSFSPSLAPTYNNEKLHWITFC